MIYRFVLGVACLGSGQRDSHGCVVTVTLFALVGRVLFLLAKTVYRTAQRLRFDALFAPLQAPPFIVGTRVLELGLMLAQRFTQPIEKGPVVLQFDGIHGAATCGRSAQVLIAVAFQLFELPL